MALMNLLTASYSGKVGETIGVESRQGKIIKSVSTNLRHPTEQQITALNLYGELRRWCAERKALAGDLPATVTEKSSTINWFTSACRGTLRRGTIMLKYMPQRKYRGIDWPDIGVWYRPDGRLQLEFDPNEPNWPMWNWVMIVIALKPEPENTPYWGSWLTTNTGTIDIPPLGDVSNTVHFEALVIRPDGHLATAERDRGFNYQS